VRIVPDDEACACGQPLHYGSPVIERAMRAQVTRLGPTIRVTAGERTWEVPRHFIALHGIRGDQLPQLGFPEVET
jgi:hypothetical protein